LDLVAKKQLIEKDLPSLSMKRQCVLLALNRASYYRKKKGLNPEDLEVLNKMDEIFTEHPYYGTRRMMHVLRQEGYMMGRKRIRRFYQILGIEAIYPKMNLSKRNQAHKIYPYLLRDLEITAPKAGVEYGYNVCTFKPRICLFMCHYRLA